jgi:hypothetical protein
VTNRRVFIARLHGKKPAEFRTFTRSEMAPPHVVKRLDGLYEVILTRRAQDKPFIIPPLESGFFGIPDGPVAAAEISSLMNH